MLHVVTMLILVIVANGAPIIAANLLGGRYSHPLDGGMVLSDGRPVFGPSKTIRGVLISMLTTTLVGFALGVGPRFGLVVAALAMCGDLLSSFVKRRFSLPSSDRARGLDQIPEALLPTLAGMIFLGLQTADVVQVVVLFYLFEVGVSPLLFRMKIRNRPH